MSFSLNSYYIGGRVDMGLVGSEGVFQHSLINLFFPSVLNMDNLQIDTVGYGYFLKLHQPVH